MNSAPIGSDSNPPVPSKVAPLPLNIRIAGFCMVVMAILIFLLASVLPESGIGAGSAVIDLILGAMLWSGNRSALGFTKFRTWAGLILGTPLMFASEGGPGAVGQLLWCLGMLALLAEKPGKPRQILGGLLMTCNLAIVSLSALVLHVGPGSLAALAYSGKTHPLPADGVVQTQDATLRIKVTRPGWELMNADEVKKQNGLFDFWLIDPKADWHVAALPETVDRAISLEELHKAVLDNNSKGKVVSEEKHSAGQIVRFHESLDGLEIERLVLIAVRPKHIYQVHAWCQSSQFSAAEPELRKVLDSIEIP